MMSLSSLASQVVTDILQEAAGVPAWVAIAALVVSSILAVIKIIEIIARRSSIDFRITREVFVRLLDQGECFYANGVAVSHGTGVLVEDIEATLNVKTIGGTTKEFPLKIINFGEKVISDNGLARFEFYTTSPLHFMPESSPQRTTYLCVNNDYAGRIGSAFAWFQQTLYSLRGQYTGPTSVDSDAFTKIGNDALACVEETCARIIDSVQLEQGRYRLSVLLNYTQNSRWINLPKRKTKRSSVEFEVGEGVRVQLRAQLRMQLLTISRNILLDQQQPSIAPEYQPINIRELEE